MFTESKEEPHHNYLVSEASFSVLYQRRLGHGPRDLFKFVENHETVYAMGQENRFKENACCYGQKDVLNCEQIHINYSLLLDYKSPIMLKDIKLTWTKTSSANTQVYRTEDDGDAIKVSRSSRPTKRGGLSFIRCGSRSSTPTGI